MALEIERKFLVINDTWMSDVRLRTRIVQGYLAHTDTTTVRVRIKGEVAFLTIKGTSKGISRTEYEYEIPVADAEAMLAEMAQGPVIDKVRHLIDVDGHTWEFDVFAGENAGLVMAEIELASDSQEYTVPGWAGLDVSDDPRYYNVNLASNPFRQWGLDG
ncbi:MAG: CYTH domain-containing protein [Candidatus Nanopelagicales bacterium]